MTTKTRIVRIGNSRGIRVPKLLLDQAELPDEVELRGASSHGLGGEGSRVPRTRRRPAARQRDLDAVRPQGLALVMNRGDVRLVRLDPTLGREIGKTRPCVIVSPDDLNLHLRTVIVAPMTTAGRAYPWRIRCQFQNRSGYVVHDQLRTVDRGRRRQGQPRPCRAGPRAPPCDRG